MFDFAWSEIALIAAVALVVIGPKDLPRVLRTVGIWVGRARTIAREFQSSLDQMVREAELEDVRKQVVDATNLDLKHEIEKTIDPSGDLQRSLSEPLVSDVDISGFGSNPIEPATPPAAPILPPPEEQAAVAPPVLEPAAPDVLAEPPATKSGTHA